MSQGGTMDPTQSTRPSCDKASLRKSYAAIWNSRKELEQIYNRPHRSREQLPLLREIPAVLQPRWRRCEAAYHRATAEYGRLSCIYLCQRMYKALPFDVREIVYANLVGSGDYDILPNRITRRMFEEGETDWSIFSRLISERACDDCGLVEHWWYEAYTGDNVDREIASAWYRKLHPRFVSGHDLVKFLTTDVTKKLLNPGQELRRIVYNVQSTVSDLEVLFEIQNKNVELTIIPTWVLHSREIAPLLPETILPLLKHIGPVVYRLRSLGYHGIKVEAQIFACLLVKDGPRDWFRKKDITYLFDLPIEELFSTGLKTMMKNAQEMETGPRILPNKRPAKALYYI